MTQVENKDAEHLFLQPLGQSVSYTPFLNSIKTSLEESAPIVPILYTKQTGLEKKDERLV